MRRHSKERQNAVSNRSQSVCTLGRRGKQTRRRGAYDVRNAGEGKRACRRCRSMSGMPRSRLITRLSTASSCPAISKGVMKPAGGAEHSPWL